MLTVKMKSKVLKVMAIIWLGMIIVFSDISQGFAGKSVENWGDFIRRQRPMLEKLFTSVIIPELVNRLINEILRTKIVDGVLTRILLTEIQQKIFHETAMTLNEIYDIYSNLKSNWHSNYFRLVSSDNVINVLDCNSGQFPNEIAKAMFLIDGDMGYVNSAFSDLQKIKDKIPDNEYRKLGMKIAELQYVKENLSNNAFSYALYIKRASEYSKTFRNFDNTIRSISSYSSEQAKKDLLKVQILNTLQLIDYARFVGENNLRKIAIKNVELSKERERLVSEMSVYKSGYLSSSK